MLNAIGPRSAAAFKRGEWSIDEAVGPWNRKWSMHLTSMTILAAAIVPAILWLGPARGLWILFATMPLGAAAAFVAPGLGNVSLTDIGILAVWLAVLVGPGLRSNLPGTIAPGSPGAALFLLLVLACLGAVFLPRIFAGQTEVFVMMKFDGVMRSMTQPLRPTGTNIGQSLRFVLGASVFFALAATFARRGVARQALVALTVATSVHAAVSAIDLASHNLGAPDLLKLIRTANYNMLDNQTFMGIRRLSGGFPEPSAFGLYTVGLYGFWLSYAFSGVRPRLARPMLLIVTFLLLRSTSSAALAAIAVITVVFFVWNLPATFRSARLARPYLVIAALAPAVFGTATVLIATVPAVSEFFNTLLFDKLESDSGVERSSWNLQAWQNFLDTRGLGAGMGSVRASSWLFSNFGNLGIAGVMLQAVFLVLLFRRTRGARDALAADRDVRAVADALLWGCAAVLSVAVLVVPSPSLDIPFYAMAGLATGLRRSALMAPTRTRGLPVGRTLPARFA